MTKQPTGSGVRSVPAPSLVVLLVTVVMVLCGLAGPHPLEAQSGSPYGILLAGIDHSTPGSTLAARMQRARDAGAAWVRVDFFWYSAQWYAGQWDWRHFDRVLQEASARGLRVLPILSGTPSWAAVDGVFSFGVPNMAAWEAFVYATVSRYRGRITLWEIWNEPDHPYFWRGTPKQYAELLARAYTQVKRADSSAVVALGGLAQGGPANLTFLQQILGDSVRPAGRYFDYHNIHTNWRYMNWIADQIQDNRAILQSYGVPKPVIVTESSYTSTLSYQNLTGYQDGEAGQARYLTDAYRTMLGQGIGLAFWAGLRDDGGTAAYSQTGIVRTDLSSKAAFLAYQKVSAAGGSCPSGQYRAEFYGNTSLSGAPAVVRCDAEIDFDWGVGGPSAGVGGDNFSARWVGRFGFSGGTYTFTATSDDGIRVWVDGALILDAWWDQGPTTYRASRTLSAGEHEVRVEYYERTGGASARLSWQLAASTTCPAGQYLAAYYGNVTLSGSPAFTRCEAAVNFAWGRNGPGNGLPADNFSVRWTGRFSFPGGNTTFSATADDGMRVWVDGSLLIDAWRDQAATTYRAARSLTAGDHDVRIEYYERSLDATAKVSWQSSSGCGVGQYFAEYFPNTGLTAPAAFTRCESAINYAWGPNGPGSGLAADNFSVRWSGRFSFPGGITTFTATADDGIRVWVDGLLVIAAWHDQAAATYQNSLNLTAGEHDVRVEYYEHAADAVVRVAWTTGSCSAGQYVAEYFANTTLSGTPAFVRCESSINHAWGAGGPGGGLAPDNFSVRWTGRFSFPGGNTTFTATADDGIRVWVDGSLLIDAWRDQAATTYRATRSLTAGAHNVKVEYYERAANAVAQVDW
jgi:hypothetical protein